jgi:hypothetical protein
LQTLVRCHPINPCHETRSASKSIQTLKNPQENLLREIGGILPADHANGHSMHGIATPLEQFPLHRPIACLTRSDDGRQIGRLA